MGCASQLAAQAISDAKDALYRQNYERAATLLLIISEEIQDEEVDSLYAQVIKLKTMRNYLAQNQLDPALLVWTEINLSPSRSRAVKDEAVRLLLDEIDKTAARLKERGLAVDSAYAALLSERLSSFEKFAGGLAALEVER